MSKRINDACSHLVRGVRIFTGKEDILCTSEEDISCGCCKDGWCPFIDDDTREYLLESKDEGMKSGVHHDC